MQLEDSLLGLWRRITFCLRVLSDLVSDLSFSALYWRSSRRGLPQVTNEILLESAVSLAARIREGRLSSEELVSACIDRIKEVNSLINAVVDTRFEVSNVTLSTFTASLFISLCEYNLLICNQNL